MKKNTAPKGIKIKMSREEIAYQIFIAVVVGLLVLCCLIPFLYVVGMSFTSEGEMIQRNFFVIIPQKPIMNTCLRIRTSFPAWVSRSSERQWVSALH